MNALDWQIYQAQRSYVLARRHLLQLLTLKVLLRDGPCCTYCKSPTIASKGPRGRTLDHITPVSLGGKDVLANVVLACRSCNSRKSTKPATAFARARTGARS